MYQEVTEVCSLSYISSIISFHVMHACVSTDL